MKGAASSVTGAASSLRGAVPDGMGKTVAVAAFEQATESGGVVTGARAVHAVATGKGGAGDLVLQAGKEATGISAAEKVVKVVA